MKDKFLSFKFLRKSVKSYKTRKKLENTFNFKYLKVKKLCDRWSLHQLKKDSDDTI